MSILALAPTTRPATTSEIAVPLWRRSIRRHLLGGLALGAVLVVGVGGWATTTSIAGAVIAPGQLVVESEVKKVQHPTGGVIGALYVRDGDHVKGGDVLIRLDATQTRANLDIVLKGIDELAARRAREEAERDGADAVAFPGDLAARALRDATVAHLMSGETALFRNRAAAREGQKAQMRERVAQLGQEIGGLQEQGESKRRQTALIEDELKGVRELWSKNLVPYSRVTALEREAARLVGERGQITATIAQTRGKVTETELQILQVDRDLRTEVGKDLAEIRGKLSELEERRIAAEDMLKRIDIRAPQSGIVHQMTVHTVGGLVTPTEPAMLIVPEADSLAVETRIQPHDIDGVRIGQEALLRFSAFNQRTTPEVEGHVMRISADVTPDPRTGAGYYTVRVQVPPDALAKLGAARLVPGMPVEAFLQTGERTVLSYLTKPLADQISKAWKER